MTGGGGHSKGESSGPATPVTHGCSLALVVVAQQT